MMRLTQRGKKRIIILTAVAIIGAAGAGAAIGLRGVYRARLADEARTNGLAALAAGDYETALAELSYSVSFYSDDLEALLAFADARRHVEELNAQHLTVAVSLYRAALRLDEENPEALNGLLALFTDLGLPVELNDVAERLLAIDSDHIPAREAQVSIGLASGKYEHLVTLAGELGRLEPGAVEWPALLLFTLNRQNETLEDQLDAFDIMVADWTGDGRFDVLRGQHLFDAGDRERALASAERGLERGTNEPRVFDALLDLLDLLGEADQANAALAAATVQFPDEPWVQGASVRRPWRAGHYAAAEQALNAAEERLGEDHPELLRCRIILALDTADSGDQLRVSLARLDAALAPNATEAQVAWSQALTAHLDHHDDLVVYRRAARLNSDDAVIAYLAGQACMRASEPNLAAQFYEDAVRRDRSWAAPQVAHAELLIELGRPGPAFGTLFDLILVRKAGNLRAHWGLIRAALDLNRTEIARERGGKTITVVSMLEQLDRGQPNQPRTVALLAEAYHASGALTDAYSIFESTLEQPQASLELLVRLADVSQRLQMGFAAPLLAQAEGRDDRAGLGAAARAGLLLDQGQPEAALKVLDAAAAIAAPREAFEERVRSVRRQAELAQLDSADRTELMRSWLKAGPADADIVLRQPEAWEDEALTLLALKALGWPEEDLASEDLSKVEEHEILARITPRLLLYRAAMLRRFHGEDEHSLVQAIRLVKRALEIVPQSRYGLELMSDLLAAGDQPLLGESIEYLERAVTLYPGALQLYPKLIESLRRYGDVDRSRRYLDRLRTIAPESGDLDRVLVTLLERDGKTDAALDLMRDLMNEGDLDSERERLRFAAMLARVGQEEEAEANYRLAATSDQASAAAALAAASYLARHHQYDEGFALMQTWAARQPGVLGVLAMGTFAAREGDRAAAETALAAATAGAATTVEELASVAQLALALGDAVRARAAAEQGLVLDGEHPELRNVLLSILLTGAETVSSADFERLSGAGGVNPAVVATIDLVRRQTVRGFADRELVDEARDLVVNYPDFVDARRAAIGVLVQAGEMDDAIRLAREGTYLFEADASMPAIAARLLLEDGQANAALEMVRIVDARDQTDPVVTAVLRATIELKLERPQAARDTLTRWADDLHRHDGAFMRAWFEAVQGIGGASDLESMIRGRLAQEPRLRAAWLDVAVTLEPDKGRAMLAFAETELGDVAVGRLELALRYTHLARRFSDQPSIERALALLEQVDARGDLATGWNLTRAVLAGVQNDTAVAERSYRAVLAVEPRHVVAVNNLANILRRAGDRCEEAISLARRAAELAPGAPDVTDTLTRALLCGGEVAEAESILQVAVERYPDHAGLRLTHARLLVDDGRVAQARPELFAIQRLLDRQAWVQPETQTEFDALRTAIDAPADAVSHVGDLSPVP